MKANGYTAAGCVVLLVAAAVAFKHAQPARPSLVIPAPVVFMLPVVADDVRVIPDVATLATLTVCHSSGGLTDWHPDPVCTPGAVASRVDPSNVRATICRTGGGYPASVRPPTSVTGPVKARLLRVYRMAGVTELDHLIPLGLGGANSIRNLAPEPSTGSGISITNPKDRVELRLIRAVCRSRNPVPLRAAQQAIATDWTTAVVKLGA